MALMRWINMYKPALIINQNSSEQVKQILVVDDHEAILASTSQALKVKYPQVEIVTALDARSAQNYFTAYQPELVVLDLSLPEQPNAIAHREVGIHLLKSLMQSTPAPNIVVLTTNVKLLVCLKPLINSYEAGFAAMDKSLPIEEMLNLVDKALRGSIYLPPEMRSRPEFDRKWIEVLMLKFRAGLTDKAIAQQMNLNERTVHNYWLRLQDALGVYEEAGKDSKDRIELAARQIGLIN